MPKYLDYEGLLEFKSQLDETYAKIGEGGDVTLNVTGTPSSSKTITSLSLSGTNISAVAEDISITISQVNGLSTALNDKVDVISGKGLSTNDFTTDLKNKLDNIEAGATANEGTVTGVTVGEVDYIPINGQITLPNYPTKVSDLTNDSGFLTSHQSLSGYATETWVSDKFNDVLGINASGIDALTTALSDNDAATGILKAIADKVDKESGKRLMTDAEGTKLSGIEAGAQTHRAPSAAEVKTALGTGSGTTKYLREDGTWATPPDTNTWPTATSQLTNDSGYITGITKSMVTTALGYTPPSSDTNTVTSINGKTGAIAAADIATVLTGAGYKLTDTDTNTTYSAGTGLSLSGTTFALATSGVTAGTYKRVTVDAYGRVTSGDNTDADSWRTVQCNGTSIGSNTLNLKAGSNVSLSNSNGTITISSTDTNTNTWRGITDSYSGTDSATSLSLKGGNALYNALVNGYASSAGSSTYSNKVYGIYTQNGGQQGPSYYGKNYCGFLMSNQTVNGNSEYKNWLYMDCYNGTDVGGATAIGVNRVSARAYIMLSDANRTSWNNTAEIITTANIGGYGYITGITKAMVTNALGYTPPTTNTTYSGSSTVTLSGTTFSLTKANVTTALGYTPPTSDTNTWRPLGTGANDACAGNDSRLSNSRPASDVYSWAKASSKPSYGYGEISHTVNSVTTSGAISLAGTTPLHIVTLNGNASSVALSSNPAKGHSCHVIFFSTAARTVAIAHHATSRVCPKAADVSLSVPANGYVEVDFLFDGSKTWVRGV